MSLKPFQSATVTRALERLRDPRGSRRFLVADEVGLGKTLVAQGVIEGLCAPGSRLRVFYVCSSLSIAHQNRDSLLEMLPPDERDSARVEVDRLTLLPCSRPHAASRLTLYTLTPGTMPLRSRGGRVDERALLARLLREVLDLRRNDRAINLLSYNVRADNWCWALSQAELKLEHVPGDLRAAFRRHVTRQLCGGAEIARSTTLADRLITMLEEDTGRGIQLLRIALSLASLESLAPDLIIFDEFQRFFELIDPDDDDLDDVARGLMERLLGAGDSAGAGVLMLSATPYRQFGGWEGGDGAHHEQFFRLLKFLFGRRGPEAVGRLRRDFDEYGQRLRNDQPQSREAIAVRDRISDALGQVMARTERTDADETDSVVCPSEVMTPLQPIDVRLLRHLRDSARDTDLAMVTPIWSSVPYPLQSMDANGYKLRDRAENRPLEGAAREAAIRTSQVFGYSRISHPHPKLRRLVANAPPELLALPWLPPTLPWWPVAGTFAQAEGKVAPEPLSKVLMFSRYRAVPRAVASVLSYEAERRAFSVEEQRKRSKKKARRYDYRARSSGAEKARRPKEGRHPQPRPVFTFSATKGVDQPLRQVLEFFPLPALARACDPLLALSKGCEKTAAGLTTEVARQLAGQLGRTTSGGDRRSGWTLVRALEEHASSWSALQSGWMSWGRSNAANRAAWSAAQTFLAPVTPPATPTDRDLEELAHLGLFSPGCVLLRAVERVFGPTTDQATRFATIARVSVGALRGYLDTPEFHKLFQRPEHKNHRLAVREAIFEGNLESVLDEYLAMLAGLGPDELPLGREPRALEQLETALQIRTSSIELNRLGRTTKFKLRCHAALPFGLAASEIVSESTGKLRSDFLRVAFNSPFRPYVLATTSIGQEGLDFHVYCSHLVHWDLPSNPVDLEQREGRIRRFGSLTVRRRMAADVADLPRDKSPWRWLAQGVKETAGGLSPWWSHKGAKVRTSAYLPPFSRDAEKLRGLLDSLALYRLTLGQTDQEHLVRALQIRLEKAGADRDKLFAWLKEARIRLSPFFGSSQTSAIT